MKVDSPPIKLYVLPYLISYDDDRIINCSICQQILLYLPASIKRIVNRAQKHSRVVSETSRLIRAFLVTKQLFGLMRVFLHGRI